MVPHGELVTIEGAGHGAHLSHPRELAALVLDLVERASVTRPGTGVNTPAP